MATQTVSVKVCRVCGASYTTSSGTYFASRHFATQHPGQTADWTIRREQREVASTVTYAFGARP
jgi:hypothetical protein